MLVVARFAFEHIERFAKTRPKPYLLRKDSLMCRAMIVVILLSDPLQDHGQ